MSVISVTPLVILLANFVIYVRAKCNTEKSIKHFFSQLQNMSFYFYISTILIKFHFVFCSNYKFNLDLCVGSFFSTRSLWTAWCNSEFSESHVNQYMEHNNIGCMVSQIPSAVFIQNSFRKVILLCPTGYKEESIISMWCGWVWVCMYVQAKRKTFHRHLW